MMTPRLLSVLAIAALAACTGPSNRLDMSPVQSELELRSLVSSAMLRDVSLPTYAGLMIQSGL